MQPNNEPQTPKKGFWGNFKENLWIVFLTILIIGILIGGFYFAYTTTNFAYVPYAVVIMGIISFFAVLKSDTLAGEDYKMRKAITVAIVVVYLGLLPTLAFQGILQFQVTDTTTEVVNQTLNATTAAKAPPVVPQNISLSSTVVSSFTALVAAVLLFYFGSRSLDGYVKLRTLEIENTKTPETPQAPTVPGTPPAPETPTPPTPSPPAVQVTPVEDPTKTAKVTTVAQYDKEEKLVGKTVTTEEIKKVE